MEDWERREFDEIKSNRDYWKREYYKVKEDLESGLQKANNKLDSAKYRINNELEPRLEGEKASYDSHVINGGSDPCMQNGMAGNCGFECSAFGERDGCQDYLSNMTEKELLKAYKDGYYDQVENEIDERGLSIKKWIIDIKESKEAIINKKNEIKKLSNHSLEYRYIRQEIFSIIMNKLKRGNK